jgi:nucleoside-diphosphate-sugar epimerase
LREGRTTDYPVQVVYGDGNDEQLLTRLQQQQKFDIVINLLIFLPEQAEMNLRAFPDVRQFIFISTVCVNDRTDTVVFTEESPVGNPDSPYGQNKRKAEELFLAAHRTAGYPVTIVRPTQTYGGEKLPLSVKGKSYWGICQRMLDGKPVIVHGDGTSTWVSTYCDDFAKGFVSLVGHEQALGEIFQITSDEVLTWNQMYQIIGEELGVTPKIVHIPTDVLAKIGMEGGIRGDKESSVVFDNRKLKRLAPDFTPAVSFREGVRLYLQGVEQHPERKKTDPAFDEKCDAVCAAWESMAEQFMK